MNCHTCGQPLTRDEIGLSKKLINRGTRVFFCLSCLARQYHVPESALKEWIEHFRETGCSLFQ